MNFQNIIQDLLDFGFTQTDLAEHCGVTQSTISHVLTGRNKNVSWQVGNDLFKLHKKHKKPINTHQP